MDSAGIANIAAFTLTIVVSVPNRQHMVKNLRSNTYELCVEWQMNWESRSTVVSLLTKLPANVHSCCNLVRTNAHSSGVPATESSP